MKNKKIKIIAVISVLLMLLVSGCSKKSDTESSLSPTESSASSSSSVEQPAVEAFAKAHSTEVIDGVTYIDGILIVNKTYSLPKSYNYGLTDETLKAFNKMKNAAAKDNISLEIASGFRSYEEQKALYNEYKAENGQKKADTFSARPGYSEHQSGMAMDVNGADFSMVGQKDMKWLEKHCAEYGFIIRFPKGKESITGYSYEPWHIRYVGKKAAKEIKKQGICLEEYLGVTSKYNLRQR